MWDELKRRNVVRVGAAYLVVAWLVLQLADVLVPLLVLPDWVGRLVLLLLVVGFIPALVFAWIYELTPDGLRRQSAIETASGSPKGTGRRLDFAIIGILTVALVVFAVERFLLLPERLTSNEDSLPAQPAGQASIAVLPFTNMSADPEQEYFSDGLTEEILNLLARVPNLKVIGRTSSFAFKDRDEDLRVIGETLGVDNLLQGSVRRSADEVRIAAQLIVAADGSQIWADSYDRRISNIFDVQEEVASAIIGALEVYVGEAPTRGQPTDSPEAYTLFLKARAAFNDFAFDDALTALNDAIALDPRFAEAYELLGFVQWYRAGNVIPSLEGQRLTAQAVNKALEIDPSLVLAEALATSADVDNYSFYLEIEALERAAREAPGQAYVFDALAFDLIEAGYLQEALVFARRLDAIDPLSPAANARLADALMAVGLVSESLATVRRSAELGNELAQIVLATTDVIDNPDDASIGNLEQAWRDFGEDPHWVREFVIGALDPATGESHLVQRIAEIAATYPDGERAVKSRLLYLWYLHLGYLGSYFDLILQQDFEASAWTDADILIYFGTVLRASGFTAHPRYLEVAERAGLMRLWEQRGPPDFCERRDGRWHCS